MKFRLEPEHHEVARVAPHWGAWIEITCSA